MDRHFLCSPTKGVAPTPRRRLAADGKAGKCVPRRSWYLRTRDSAGRRVSISFKSEHEARSAAARLEAAKVLGVPFTPRATAVQVPTFSTVADEAMKLYQSTMSPRASTLVNHRSFLERHLKPWFGAKPITSITALEIQRFIAGKRADLSDSTIKTSLPTLRLVRDHGAEGGPSPGHPCAPAQRWVAAEAAERGEASA